jgi:hypothetical protein
LSRSLAISYRKGMIAATRNGTAEGVARPLRLWGPRFFSCKNRESPRPRPLPLGSEARVSVSECGDSSPLSLAATRRGVSQTADESAVEKAGPISRTPKFRTARVKVEFANLDSRERRPANPNGADPGVSTFLTGFSLSDLPIRLPRPHTQYCRRFTVNSPRISAKLVSVRRKCPNLRHKCPIFSGHFVIDLFVFINIPASNVFYLKSFFAVSPAGPSQKH